MPLALPAYALSLGGAAPELFCRLDAGRALRLLCSVAVEAVGGGRGELRVAVGGALAAQGSRLQRVLEAAVLLERYPKTRFVLTLSVLHCAAAHDVLHHLVNAATLTLLHAQVEMRLVPLGSSCFVAADGKLLGEEEAQGAQAVLVQAFGPERQVLLLSLQGAEAALAPVLALLSAAVAKTGRELLGQLKRGQ